MSDRNSEQVRTELSEGEYEQFREFAEERGLSIEEAAREALLEWTRRPKRADTTDPAFTVLDELDATTLPDSAATDARGESDLVE